MNLTISDPALKKAILRILAGYEVNEQGMDIGEAGPFIAITDFPLDDLRKAITQDAMLTVFSCRPFLEEGEVVRSFLDNGILKPNQLVYVGLARMTKEEAGFLAEKNVRNYPMREIAFTSSQEVCDAAMQVSRQRKELVVLVDLSVLDPAFFPGMNAGERETNREPGGMTSRELIYFMQRFRLLKNLKAIIITGYGKEAPAALLAKMVAEVS
jgi:hypothetical protein